MITKPPRGVGIDWANPLTKGLAGCWLFNEFSGLRFFDIVNKTEDTPSSDGSSLVWKPYGLEWQSSPDYIRFGYKSKLDSSSFTILAIVFVSSTSSWLPVFSFGVYANHYDMYTHSDNISLIINGDYSGHEKPVPGGYANKRRIVTVGFNGVDTRYYWAEGRFLGTTSSTAVPTVDVSKHGKIGSSVRWSSERFSGKIELIIVWNRLLSDSEVKRMHLNPYQIFEPAISPAVFEYVSSGGITQTYTIDTVIKSILSKTSTIDVAISELKSTQSTIDTIIFELMQLSNTIDTVVQESKSSTITIDTIVKALRSSSISIDTIVEEIKSSSYTIDVNVVDQVSTLIQALIDVVVEQTVSSQVDVDVVVQELKTLQNQIDTVVYELRSATYTIDSVVEMLSSSSVSVDIVLQELRSKTFTSDIAVCGTFSSTYTADTNILANYLSFTIDVYIFEEFGKWHKLNPAQTGYTNQPSQSGNWVKLKSQTSHFV